MFRSRISSALIIILAKGSSQETDEARQLMIIEKIITLHAPNDPIYKLKLSIRESRVKGKLSSVKTGCCGSVAPLFFQNVVSGTSFSTTNQALLKALT